MDTPAQQSQASASQSPPSTGAGVNKEIEVGSPAVEAPGLKEVGQEVEIAPEAAQAGIKVRPASITMPQPMGASRGKPVGARAPSPTANLPLTDEQIVQGLRQSIAFSWRWLAEWCRRRLKQLKLLK